MLSGEGRAQKVWASTYSVEVVRNQLCTHIRASVLQCNEKGRKCKCYWVLLWTVDRRPSCYSSLGPGRLMMNWLWSNYSKPHIEDMANIAHCGQGPTSRSPVSLSRRLVSTTWMKLSEVAWVIEVIWGGWTSYSMGLPVLSRTKVCTWASRRSSICALVYEHLVSTLLKRRVVFAVAIIPRESLYSYLRSCCRGESLHNDKSTVLVACFEQSLNSSVTKAACTMEYGASTYESF